MQNIWEIDMANTLNSNKRNSISVCMATYNGEKYIEKQLDSILKNLTNEDELIISDDGSTDNTIDILNKYAKKYKQIVLLEGPRKGVIKNFEYALKYAKKDIIFLSDQDDEWEQDKVEKVIREFNKEKTLVVVHDACVIDAEGHKILGSLFEIRKSQPGLIKNLVKNSYVGCCMTVRRELLQVALPFPENIEMHDWWLGLISDCKNGTVFINEKLIRYRRHENNVSRMKHYPLMKMVDNRICFIKNLIIRLGLKK